MKRHLIPAVVLLVFGAGPAAACNPDPPLPPILEGHAYDRVAMEYLIRDAVTIGIARYVGRVDIFMEEMSADPETRTRYIFDLREGWKDPLPARLVVPGYWLSCELPLREGGSYLVYLDGTVPLYVLPAERAAVELETLGDLDWFYSQTGELRRPELVNEVGEDGAADEAGGTEETQTR